MRFTTLFFTALAAGVFVSPVGAQKESAPGFGGLSSKPESVATLIPEVTAIAPGKPFTAALRLAHPDPWHSYYQNSGGIEQSITLNWTLPEGFTAGPIQWPTPHVIDGAFGKSFSYSGTPILLVDITPPATLAAGTSVTLKADADWQICTDSGCENEKASFTLELPVKATAETDAAQAGVFTAARAELPKPATGWTVKAENEGPLVKLRLTPPGNLTPPADLDFIPTKPFIGSLSSGGTIAQEGGEWVLTLKRMKETVIGPIEQGTAFGGILTSHSTFDTVNNSSSLLIPEVTIGRPAPRPLDFAAFLPVLGGMLLGGLILNLMPCVFPVLGLKIMGFVQQSGQDKRKVVMHGLVFTAGVLVSFWVVSGILFALRQNSTQEIGWAYQLQNKWFVYGLVMLFWVFGLSMFGLFEIGVSATSVGGKLQSKEGLAGSFFSGVLATVVATPCSAPILGPAIGAAITLPAVQFFTAFTAMALGLALPYLIFSIFPKLVDLLPRPGAWMESFKVAMSFLLLGAAGYFFWVFLEHVAEDARFTVTAGLLLIAVAAWIYGRWGTPFRPARVRFIGRTLTAAIAALGFYLSTGPYKGLEWERWSQGKVDGYLDKDVPVYVDFTAKWCVTCQWNKKVAYDEEVVKLFKERGIVAMRADKTRPDPEIDAAVAELGRAAIPVNVLYIPGKDPIITPEILTASYMKELINREVPPAEKE